MIKRTISWALIVVLAGAWAISQLWHPLRSSTATTLWLLNVGQGLSILIREPSGKLLLFDTGPDDKVISELGKVLPIWEHTIDLVAISHWHSDHIKGLIGLSRRYTIHEVWHSDASYHGPIYTAVQAALSEASIPHHSVRAQYECEQTTCPPLIPFGESFLQVMHPVTAFSGRDPTQAHDAGVVLLYTSATTSILLTGDLDESHERIIVGKCKPPSCTLASSILQIPHHGSSSGLLPSFLEAINPTTALIGVGIGNTYHHPNPTILERLEKLEIPIYRTDRDGTVQLILSDHPYVLVAPIAVPP